MPSLTPKEYYKTKDKIDLDGNNSVKQDEIIEYLNKNNISEERGKKIWAAYGDKNWKTIPSLKNGQWSK